MSQINGKSLHPQAREIVYNVIQFMSEEGNQGKFMIPPRRVLERVSQATGISLGTVRRIKKQIEDLEYAEADDGTLEFSHFLTACEKPKKKRPVYDLDLDVIRRVVNYFYSTEKTEPSAKKFLQKLKDDYNFQGSEATLRRILKRLGYEWKNIGELQTSEFILEPRCSVSSNNQEEDACDDEEEEEEDDDDNDEESSEEPYKANIELSLKPNKLRKLLMEPQDKCSTSTKLQHDDIEGKNNSEAPG